MKSISVRFEDIRAVADEIVFDAHQMFAAIPKLTLIVLPPSSILDAWRKQTQTSSKTSSSTATTSLTATTATPSNPFVLGLLLGLISLATRPIVSIGESLSKNEQGDWSIKELDGLEG